MEIDLLLEKLYEEPDLDKRRYIPDKLAKLGDWKSTIPLGELIISDNQPDIMRNEAVESLGKQGDPRAVPYLIKLLEDPDDEIRRTAVWSLGQIGTPETLEPVFSMTNDPNIEVRRWVAKSAGRIRTDMVINYLTEYYKQINLTEERVLADILRAVTTQINRTSQEDLEYWTDQSYEILQNKQIKAYVKQAAILLLNSCFERGINPRSNFLKKYLTTLSDDDPLVRPNILISLGYAKEIEFLRNIDDRFARIALGIANDIDYLQNELSKTSQNDTKYIEELLEAFIQTEYLPNISEYINYSDLGVRLKALELHAIHTENIETIHEAYQQGKGRYKILEIYRYYGDSALSIFEKSAFDKDKVARQNTVYSLISDHMLNSSNSLNTIQNILTKVTNRDNIWHIRRDARIGIEKIQQMVI